MAQDDRARHRGGGRDRQRRDAWADRDPPHPAARLGSCRARGDQRGRGARSPYQGHSDRPIRSPRGARRAGRMSGIGACLLYHQTAHRGRRRADRRRVTSRAMSTYPELLRRTAELAVEYLEGLPDRPVMGEHDVSALRAELVTDLPEAGEDPATVIERLAEVGGRAAVAMAGPRYFGFVIGGALPSTIAADWLTSTWDQNAGLYVAGPAAAVVEEAVGAWLKDLFGLPAGSGFGLVTGCQMAHFTALAAGRQAVLERAGWDATRNGLFGAPEIEVILSAEAHSTVLTALQYLGLGRDRVRRVAADGEGRLVAAELAEGIDGLAPGAPLIASLQAGNLHTASFAPS